MQGHDVLFPMGWDAFGLPAENAALERSIHPAKWTAQNIAKMKGQLLAMNAAFDWSKVRSYPYILSTISIQVFIGARALAVRNNN